MIRVACYIRVSSQEQKLHGISLDAQRDKLKEYADKNNFKIVGWYEDEGVSGRKLIRKRPELQRMLNDAQAGLFDRIIFIKLDRFFRSVAEYHESMKKIDPVIWTATEEKYDLATANGRAFVNMKLTIAELEADQTGERIKIVNDYKVKNGQAITGYKALTMGFTTATVNGVKKVIKNPETAPIVEDFLQHFLTYHNVAHAYRYAKFKYNAPQGYNAFRNQLFDTHLYGHYRGNDNYNEPYITKEQFDQIQALLKRNVKHTPSGFIFLYTGLIRCPKCGRLLSSRKHDVDGRTYVYYRCPAHIRERTCDYFGNLKEVLIERELLDIFNAKIRKHIEAVEITEAQTKTSDETQIKELEAELSRLNKMFQKNRITEVEYDRSYNDIEGILTTLKSNVKPVKRDLTPYYDLLNNDWRELYNALNKENKRAFWRKYIKEIRISPDDTISDVIFF